MTTPMTLRTRFYQRRSSLMAAFTEIVLAPSSSLGRGLTDL
jgi:hypothetical protein